MVSFEILSVEPYDIWLLNFSVLKLEFSLGYITSLVIQLFEVSVCLIYKLSISL